MSVVRFRERVYLNYKNTWFLWEPVWEQYRPVEAVRWNGEQYALEDGAYTSDPTSEDYGYGSDKMRELCSALTEKFPANTAVNVLHLPLGPLEWFRDRMVSVSPCASRDISSWKRMAGGRVRTCRAGPRNRFTKRNLIHL